MSSNTDPSPRPELTPSASLPTIPTAELTQVTGGWCLTDECRGYEANREEHDRIFGR